MEKMMRILIADDEKPIRILLTRALKGPNLEIDHAENGIKALQLVNDRNYDLIITDYQMPGMNGFELTRWIKTNYPSIPIIIITGYGPTEVLMNSGAQICLPKPFKLLELRKLVKNLLEQI